MRDWLEANGGPLGVVVLGLGLTGFSDMWVGLALVALGLLGWAAVTVRRRRGRRDSKALRRLQQVLDARPQFKPNPDGPTTILLARYYEWISQADRVVARYAPQHEELYRTYEPVMAPPGRPELNPPTARADRKARGIAEIMFRLRHEDALDEHRSPISAVLDRQIRRGDRTHARLQDDFRGTGDLALEAWAWVEETKLILRRVPAHASLFETAQNGTPVNGQPAHSWAQAAMVDRLEALRQIRIKVGHGI